jgi:hypothetical protein
VLGTRQTDADSYLLSFLAEALEVPLPLLEADRVKRRTFITAASLDPSAHTPMGQTPEGLMILPPSPARDGGVRRRHLPALEDRVGTAVRGPSAEVTNTRDSAPNLYGKRVRSIALTLNGDAPWN